MNERQALERLAEIRAGTQWVVICMTCGEPVWVDETREGETGQVTVAHLGGAWGVGYCAGEERVRCLVDALSDVVRDVHALMN